MGSVEWGGAARLGCSPQEKHLSCMKSVDRSYRRRLHIVSKVVKRRERSNAAASAKWRVGREGARGVEGRGVLVPSPTITHFTFCIIAIGPGGEEGGETRGFGCA